MTAQIMAQLVILILCAVTAYAQPDNAHTSSDTTIIRGARYIVQLDSLRTFRVVSNGDTTILAEDYFPGDLRLVDFDADGCTDILVTFRGNIPEAII